MRRARIERSAKAEKARTADEGPDAIRCLLCGETYRAIRVLHLRRWHGFDGEHPVEDYKRQFGLDVAVCRSTRRTLRRNREDYWERHGQRWPRERVLAELKRRARDGKSLASSRLGTALELAVRRRFGTWERAMKRAGLDPDAHRLTRIWNRARLIEYVRRLHVPGEPLTATRVKKIMPDLYRAAVRLVGNWTSALQAAGLDPKENREPTKWSLARARSWVLAAHARGRSILSHRVPSGLLGRVARDTHHTWVEFVESLGIPYPGQHKRLDWTNAAVLSGIRDRRRSGMAMNSKALQRDEGEALLLQARKRFGSWDDALRAAGIDPATVRLTRRWSRDSVLAAILARRSAGKPLDRLAVEEQDGGLLQAAQDRFAGKWERALAAAGIDPSLTRRSGGPPRQGRGR